MAKQLLASKPENTTPKISVIQLAEYLSASPLKRKRIVMDAKNPPKVKIAGYQYARRTTRSFLKGDQDIVIINNAIEKLKLTKTETDFRKSWKGNNIGELEHIENIEFPDLSYMNIFFYERLTQYLVIEGVRITVNPDLLLEWKVKGEVVKQGAIKFQYTKSGPPSVTKGEIVATILRAHIEEYIVRDQDVVDNSLCFFVDVYNESLTYAPRSYQQKMNQVKAACQEIYVVERFGLK
jgi:hypothetical protein